MSCFNSFEAGLGDLYISKYYKRIKTVTPQRKCTQPVFQKLPLTKLSGLP